MVKIGNHYFSSGDSVVATIEGLYITNARLYIEPSSSQTKRVYICHNESYKDGSRSPNMYGYKCSWVFYSESPGAAHPSRSFGGIGSKCHPSVSIEPASREFEYKENVDVSCELNFFLENFSTNYRELLQFKIGSFKSFTKYTVSSKEGCINLSDGKKSIDIKISRLMRHLITKFNEVTSGTKYDVSDVIIEDIYNKFVSHQSKFVIRFLSGEDILWGYSSDFIMDGETGTLFKSCMLDKPSSWLKIYTRNPEVVQLAIVMSDNRIVSRCLVWTASDGKKYMDKAYYTQDWMYQFMIKSLEEQGISKIGEESIVVKLKKCSFSRYPYIDTMYYLDMKEKTLSNYGNISCRRCRDTGGRYE